MGEMLRKRVPSSAACPAGKDLSGPSPGNTLPGKWVARKRGAMGKDELQELSCVLIACAGDAYGHFNTAINLASEGSFDAAEGELKAGRVSVAEGHKSQLALLRDEAVGTTCPIGILEVHAQDHLMNAMSFENTARQIIALYRRVENLEGGDR